MRSIVPAFCCTRNLNPQSPVGVAFKLASTKLRSSVYTLAGLPPHMAHGNGLMPRTVCVHWHAHIYTYPVRDVWHHSRLTMLHGIWQQPHPYFRIQSRPLAQLCPQVTLQECALEQDSKPRDARQTSLCERPHTSAAVKRIFASELREVYRRLQLTNERPSSRHNGPGRFRL